MAKTPVRFRPARKLAWLVTGASVLLAVLKRGQYDPTLAVLTATLIAVIWYTYWSYRAANREEASYLLLDFEAHEIDLTLIPIAANPTRRTLRVRIFLDVWADRQPKDIGPLFRGEEPMIMGPGERWSGALQLTERPRRMGMPIPQLVSVRWRATWTDDLGEPGESQPKHWTVDFTTGAPLVIARLGESEVKRYFDGLPALNIPKADSDVATLAEGERSPAG